ncbi:hypothetical protein FIBSPDRAFT_906343 [Athelia psychrophila]|uniref:C2H2-type domain-containing protein n=1 Tax=Athelia psychrophila TaxID=1759441 RepID=A0A166WV86_9AGAM|nr:hypothetical protein FIBSPDRAFT_906343 [Fibularhizoctonia sp. CBS 109695]
MPPPRVRAQHTALRFLCPYASCNKGCRSPGGLKRHTAAVHPKHTQPTQPPLDIQSPAPSDRAFDEDDEDLRPGSVDPVGPRAQAVTHQHPIIDGTPCDLDGNDLPAGEAPPARTALADDDFSPYEDRASFEIADFLYRRNQMPGTQIDDLMNLWSAKEDAEPPFTNKEDVYETIDSTTLGDAPWESFSVKYQGLEPEEGSAPWMEQEYDVWCRNPRTVMRNQLANPDFDGEIDYQAKQTFAADGQREYSDMMSGNWAWQQSDTIAADISNHGAMFVPVWTGSDKTTVSVGTGHVEFYPLYAGIGNVHNNVRRAHRNAISLIGFLAIPKTDREYKDDPIFRKFRRQLFHSSIARILEPLKAGMTTAEVTRCPDGHFRRVIYGLGPYIADYPEQCLLACIVQNWCPRCTSRPDNLDTPNPGRRTAEHTEAVCQAFNLKTLWEDYGIVGDLVPYTADFPRADIHALITPDLLHQIIKGTFKDHLVTWVGEYLVDTWGPTAAAKIMADIDRRIAAVPPFPCLRRFPEGRGFKQWTGDDSKALMKVYLPAIKEHVPPQMVRAISAFLDFCYLVRRNTINEATLDAIDDALTRFHHDRVIFEETGVVHTVTISLPRQHSMLFGAPNGICSSITESKHIKAVKEPWRRSSHHAALGQMLVINQRIDKLHASRVDFKSRGMLEGPCLGFSVPTIVPALPVDDDDDDDDDTPPDGELMPSSVTLARRKAPGYPRRIVQLAAHISQPAFPDLLRRFLYDQLNPGAEIAGADIAISDCPMFAGKVCVYPSAGVTFYAPSDPSSLSGLRRERIRSVRSWRRGPARKDCIFIQKANNLPGFRGLHAARLQLLFSFHYQGITYPCALVQWFIPLGDEPCEDTGMWMVEPEMDDDDSRVTSVIHLDCVVRGAHLIPVYGERHLDRTVHFTNSLDLYSEYYINKYADHHAFEIAF